MFTFINPSSSRHQVSDVFSLVNGASLSSLITFTRSSSKSYYDISGALRLSSMNEPTFDALNDEEAFSKQTNEVNQAFPNDISIFNSFLASITTEHVRPNPDDATARLMKALLQITTHCGRTLLLAQMGKDIRTAFL